MKTLFIVGLRMISLTPRKIINALILTGIFIIIIMPDVVFGLLFELLHFLFELLLEFAHLLFEAVESVLDTVIEHLFDTGLHDTQVIVYYILLAAIFYGLFRLSLRVPGIYRRAKENLLITWTVNKTRTVLYWQNIPLINKIKWLTVSVTVLTLYVMFGM